MDCKKAFCFLLWVSCSALAMIDGGGEKFACEHGLFKVLLDTPYENLKDIFAQKTVQRYLKDQFGGNEKKYLKSAITVATDIIRKSKPGSLDEKKALLAIQRAALVDSCGKSKIVEFLQWFAVAFCGAWLGSEGVYPMSCGIKNESVPSDKRGKNKFYLGVPPFYKVVAKITGDAAAPWVMRGASAMLIAGGFFYLKRRCLHAKN